MNALNPNLRHRKRTHSNPEQLVAELCKGSLAALSQALTLVESNRPEHRLQAERLIQLALPHSQKSLRIGITGVPGVGKSTFIEAFGQWLIARNHRLAVLAIDPSSARTQGSILADKTRMEKLTQDSRAFIRPSPSGGSLGGVARRTRESIILCEAAGFDLILVETVGVGQSETAVKQMVDFFILLLLAGAGDELQGIKRGIMEMADLLVIHKADDPQSQAVRFAMGEYKRALHLFPPAESGWIPRVLAASAIRGAGLEDIWKVIDEFSRGQKLKGNWDQNRRQQALHWFNEALGSLLQEQLTARPAFRQRKKQLELQIQQGEVEAFAAARRLVEDIFGK